MDKANNECYKRIYVNDIKGLVVAGKEIPDLDSIQGTTLGDLQTDAFDNTYYDMNKTYVRSSLDCKSVKPTQDYIRHTYTPITGTPSVDPPVTPLLIGDPCANPAGDSVSSFDSPLSCSVFLPLAASWVRTDIDCKKVDIDRDNPNYEEYIRSIYLPRDYQRRTYGEYDSNGKWITLPKETTCQPLNPVTTVVLSTVNVSDWEFTYENGVLIAREEGYTDYIEPENNTVVYKV